MLFGETPRTARYEILPRKRIAGKPPALGGSQAPLPDARKTAGVTPVHLRNARVKLDTSA